MLGSKGHWRFAVCFVSVPVIVLAGGCSSGRPSSSPSGQEPASHPGAPGGAGADQMSRPNAPSPGTVTSGILAATSVGNKRIYGFIDPNAGKYSEAVTFTIPTASQPASSALVSPDLTKFAISSMVNGQLMAGWIDSSGQFTAVTTSVAEGPFGGNPPSYTAIGFDGAGNYYYKKNSEGANTEVYEVPAGSTSNAQKVTVTPPGAADHGATLNSDGSLLFGCGMAGANWLDANNMVSAIAPGTQIAKVAVVSRAKGGCPITGNQVPLLPATNSARVSGPVANSDGTKVAFFGPDPAKQNLPTVYIVGTDGKSQPTLVNLSESDAKKLSGAAFLRWS